MRPVHLWWRQILPSKNGEVETWKWQTPTVSPDVNLADGPINSPCVCRTSESTCFQLLIRFASMDFDFKPKVSSWTWLRATHPMPIAYLLIRRVIIKIVHIVALGKKCIMCHCVCVECDLLSRGRLCCRLDTGQPTFQTRDFNNSTRFVLKICYHWPVERYIRDWIPIRMLAFSLLVSMVI